MSATELDLGRSFRSVFEHFPQAALRVDGNGRVVDSNQAAGPILGKSPPLAGTTLESLAPGIGALFRRSDSSTCIRRVVRLVSDEGPPRPALLLAWPENTPAGGWIVLLDAASTEEPPCALPADVLAPRVGHELANLLTPMLGYIELTRLSDDAPADVHSLMETFLHISRRMLLHVQNLLMIRDRPEPSLRAMPAEELVRRGVSLAAETGLLAPHQVEIIPAGRPLFLLGEGDLVQHLLINLLVNAAEAMRIAGRIEVRLVDAGRHVEIEVADTGPGVDEELRERIFEPFYSTKSNGRGIGLGLYVSRRIAQRLGGTLLLRSNRPAGSVFVARLAAAPS